MPGGTPIPLSEGAQAEVRHKIPGLPMDRINRVVEEYRIYREHTPAKPKQVREEIERIVKLTSELRLAIALASEETRDQFAIASRGRELIYQAHPFLSELGAQARAAFNVSPKPRKGDRANADGPMIRSLAGIIESVGKIADAKGNGPLCRLVEIVLRDTGKHVADIPDLVERSLAARGEMSEDSI
jgi:hypothetical protein